MATVEEGLKEEAATSQKREGPPSLREETPVPGQTEGGTVAEERTVGQEGPGSDTPPLAPVQEDSNDPAEGGEKKGTNGAKLPIRAESKTRRVSVSAGGASSHARKKSVSFGAPAGRRASESQRPGGRGKLPGRGSKRESTTFSGPTRIPLESVQKGAGKATWLVPVFKSTDFVPMFEVPRDGPLMTSRRARSSFVSR
jgi:hypothetical protein